MPFASCALCSGAVSLGEVLRGRAVRFEGATYGACCRAQIDDLLPARRPLAAKLGAVALVVVASTTFSVARRAPALPLAASEPAPLAPSASPQGSTRSTPSASELAAARGAAALSQLEADLGGLLAERDATLALAAPPLRVGRCSLAFIARVPSPEGGDGSVRALVAWSLEGSRLVRRIERFAREGEASRPGPAAPALEGVRSIRFYVAREAGGFEEPSLAAQSGEAFQRDARVSLDGFSLRAPADFLEPLAPGDEVTVDLAAASDDLDASSALYHVRALTRGGATLDGRAPEATSAIAHAFARPRALRVAIEVATEAGPATVEREIALR